LPHGVELISSLVY